MNIKYYIGGMVGGMVGCFIGVGLGGPNAAPWLAFIGIIIGFAVVAYYASQDTPKLSEERQKEINLENYICYYKTLLKNLPKMQLGKLAGVISHTTASLGLPVNSMPDELLKIGGAIATIQKEDNYGIITQKQTSEIDTLIKELNRDLSTLIPVLNNQMNQAIDKGLGFGVIGNGADVALHSIMDAHERSKNFRTANRAANALINEKIKNFAQEIKKILS